MSLAYTFNLVGAYTYAYDISWQEYLYAICGETTADVVVWTLEEHSLSAHEKAVASFLCCNPC